MVTLEVIGIDSIGGMKVSVTVDWVCVMKVVLAILVLVLTVSVLNAGYGLPEVILAVAAMA